MSIHLSFDSSILPLSGNLFDRSDDFTVNYPSQIILDRDHTWEVALYSASVPYAWYNISAEYGNNILRYYTPRTSAYVSVTLPNGIYGDDALNEVIFRLMEEQGDYIQVTTEGIREPVFRFLPNTATGRFYVNFHDSLALPTQYRIDFTQPGLRDILGFDAQEISTTKEAENLGNINRGINVLQIHCDLVSGSYINAKQGDVIYIMNINVPPGARMSVQPFKPIPLPVSKNEISSVRIYITDQLGRPINLNNEGTNFALHISRAQG